MLTAIALAASLAGQCAGCNYGSSSAPAYGYAAPAYGYVAPAYGYVAPAWGYNAQPAYVPSYQPYSQPACTPPAYYPVYRTTWPHARSPALPSQQR